MYPCTNACIDGHFYLYIVKSPAHPCPEISGHAWSKCF